MRGKKVICPHGVPISSCRPCLRAYQRGYSVQYEQRMRDGMPVYRELATMPWRQDVAS